MPNLSPPAQAVLDAYRKVIFALLDDDWNDEQHKRDLKCLAAALRAAAADQTLPNSSDWYLLADELEAQ